MAGVIMPSPYSRAVPKMPSAISTARPSASRGTPLLPRARPGTSAVKASTPPSPWLSARITNATYLIEMTRMSE